MAEEITYIPYGLDEISQQDLMTSLANGVPGYLDSKRWAKKDKYRLAWLNAYLDIVGHGLLGASNNSGLWNVQYGQDPIDLSTKSNIEREMYQDAAYYIQLQMSLMPLHKKEEEKKKEDLEKYGDFETNLMNQILKGYGNNSKLFADSEQGWDAQDARGADGLRGTKNRKEAMIKALSAYRDSLNDKDYNFEGTSFKDKADLQTKIQAAIDALGTNEETDDLPAFNALGLPYRAFFSNGGNDPYTKGDYTGTYAGYNEYLAKQNNDKQKAEQEKLKQQRANQYTNFRFYGQGLMGTPPTGNDALQRLNTYASLSKLDGNQQSELVGAFKFAEKNGILQNLSKEELLKFGSRWMSNSSRLKKINGLNGFYWDSVGQRVVLPYNQSNVPTAGFLDLVNLNSPEALALKQLTTPRGKGIELTSADKRDIYATLADLGAFVNPEVFTGTAMALSASGARTWNSIELNGLWDTLTDWKTWADWGTGALGGTQLLGDASSVVKFARGLGKVMTIPAIVNALYNMPEAKAAWDKIDLNNPIESVKKLTPLDYHALSSFLVGVLSGKNYIKGNLAERKVLQESGFNTLAKTKRREYANKFGITRTKTSNLLETPTLKIKKTGEDGKIEEQEIGISKEQLNILLNTKPSELNNKAKELLKERFPEGFEVKTNNSWSRSKINNAKSIVGKANSEIFGKSSTETSRGTDNFENWINSRSLWDQYKPWSLGTNSNLRKIRTNILGKDFDKSELVSSASGEESPYAKKPLEQGKVKATNHIEGLPDKSNVKESYYNRDIMNSYRKVMEGKFSSKEIQGGKESIKIGNENVRVYTTKDAKGNNSLYLVSTSTGNHKFKTQEEAKKFIAKIVKQLKNNIVSGKITKENVKEIGKVLLELKRKGWLKQGGTINTSLDNIIEDFFKNNNI